MDVELEFPDLTHLNRMTPNVGEATLGTGPCIAQPFGRATTSVEVQPNSLRFQGDQR